MNNKSKKVVLLTGTEATRLELVDQLAAMLQDYVEIKSYATDLGLKEKIVSDLVVISSKLILDDAMPYIDEKCPIIFARRALNISNVDKLFSIPEGTEVLLVNDTPETTKEVIELMSELGIDHIRFVPHYPGCKPEKKLSMAITPGERTLVPDFVKEIVDIGPRIIDLTTIVEILEKLNLLDEKAHYVSAKYMETIVRLGKQLYLSIKESNKINEHLNKVLNQVNDGILAFNKDGRITVFNQKSEEIFKLRQAYALGKNIGQVIKDPQAIDFLQNDKGDTDHIMKINDTEIIISKFAVEKLDSTVCTLKDSRDVAEIEQKLRRNLIKKGHIGKYNFADIIGESRIMLDTVNTARKISKVNLSILIHGESGTGKELFASAIHNESNRSAGPYLAVNFSALPEDLVESELFGYEEGAFTGAKKGGKQGLFEQANNGTIFLDEIGDTSLKIQARLLRVLQEKEIMRVGGAQIVPVDVRVIAATNKDLFRMCQEGKFREDLYYRLKKLYLKTPPLRERSDDISVLVRHFLAKNNRKDLKISPEVMDFLISYKWPGNVRELESTIEYMVAVCEGQSITIEHLPQDFFETGSSLMSRENSMDNLGDKGPIEEFLFILDAVAQCNKTGKPAGRKTLSEMSCNFRYTLSEEQIRKRTGILEEMGLLIKSRGRSGMHLSIKGKTFVDRNYQNTKV